MSAKKKKTAKRGDRPARAIHTGGGNYYEGKGDTKGGAFVGGDQVITTGATADEIARLFVVVQTAIDKRPNTPAANKADLKAEVKELAKHAEEEGNRPVESFVARRMRNIGRMAPDILDTIIATAGSPVSGFMLIAKKTAEKAKELAGK